MVLSKKDFVFRMIAEMDRVPYLYRSYVYSMIKGMNRRGIHCEASDEEVYVAFSEAWNRVYVD